MPASAVMRFSKACRAHGQPARIGARGGDPAFLWSSARFIRTPFFQTRHPAAPGYIHKYFSLLILASIFFISARARKARTLTSGTDQPVNSAISFTERSSISNSVMTSCACGDNRSITRPMSNFAASASLSGKVSGCGGEPLQASHSPAALNSEKDDSRFTAGVRAKNRSRYAPSSA